jgi:uncharacterized lipoprotein YmbA
MNCVHGSIALVASFGLAACASNPVEDRYYSLVLAADDSAAPDMAVANAVLIVGPIQLPEYLNKRGLTMQVDSNQVQSANHHFWAEPLDEAISKVLVRDIARRNGNLGVERDAGRWTGAWTCRLRIEFDKFHATNRSSVVSSGRYWVSSSESSVKQEFDVTQRLSADGYGPAVAALRESLDDLAMQINETINNNSQCSGDE